MSQTSQHNRPTKGQTQHTCPECPRRPGHTNTFHHNQRRTKNALSQMSQEVLNNYLII